MTMQVKRDDLWLCDDCLFAAVNGDANEDSGRDAVIMFGLEALGPHLVPDFDSETGEGVDSFSRTACACCFSHWAGQRHRFAVLGPVE
jgi:hypothetical protein